MVDRDYDEILQGTKLYNTLPAHLYVIAGHAYARTDISILVILKLLQDLHESATFSQDYESSGAKALLLGNLPSARSVVDSAIDFKRASSERPTKVNNFQMQIEADTAIDDEESEEEAPVPIVERKSMIMRRKNKDEIQETKGRIEEKTVCERESTDCPMCEVCRDPNLTVDFALDCHLFHSKCLSTEIQKQIRNAQFPVVCPVNQCKVELLPLDIKACLSHEWIAKYEKLTVEVFINKQGSVLSNCPLCGCSFEVIKGVTRIACPACKQFVCLKCKVKFHDGITCQEFSPSKNECKDTGTHGGKFD